MWLCSMDRIRMNCLDQACLRAFHSMANAVVNEAGEGGLVHQEMHPGWIISWPTVLPPMGDERVGNRKPPLAFEDEGCRIPRTEGSV